MKIVHFKSTDNKTLFECLTLKFTNVSKGDPNSPRVGQFGSPKRYKKKGTPRGLVLECDPVIFCLKFGNYLQFIFEMIKDKKAWQINLGLGLKLGLGLELRVRVRIYG